MKREELKDVTGKPMDYRTQKKAVEEYNRSKKERLWNFPLRDAFIRAGVIKIDE